MYVKRDIEDKIEKFLFEKEIIAVIGPRQCGKTTLIEQILSKQKGRINKISFDNQKIMSLFEEDPDSFIEKHVKGYDFVFIDEVQYSKKSGKILKYIYDSTKQKIIISGSSASELAISSLKYLVGRIIIFKLFPFSFKEYLRAKDEKLLKIYEKQEYGTEINNEINQHLDEFIRYGGYPRVVLTPETDKKKIILQNIFDTYLLREIKEILGLSSQKELITLLKTLSLQIGNLVVYDNLSATSGFNYENIKKYLNILEKTYICSFINSFHKNKNTELIKSTKVYFFDLGFRNIIIDNFSKERTDKGALYENFVFSELIKKELNPKFWRTKAKAEVDFVIEQENTATPLEIKTNINREEISRSFRSFIETYKPKKGYITSLNYESKTTINKTEIHFVPITKVITFSFNK